MIDKQKLLQWVEKKKHVYSGPYDDDESEEDQLKYKGALMLLSVLERDVEAGEFEEEGG